MVIRRFVTWCAIGACLSSSVVALQIDQTPGSAEQERMLQAIRQYARQYVSNLPNFVCVQVTHQFEAGKKPNHWRKGDTLTSKLTFNKGREERSLEMVNNKPVQSATRRWRAPLTTEGEFGILLDHVFSSMTDASFAWSRWESVREKRLAVFDYSIDQANSTLRLTLNDLKEAIVPYHGSIYADPSSGAIWRVTNRASDLPAELETKEISTTVDYGEIRIGASTYLLPVQAAVYMTSDMGDVRNVIEFTNYRKFEADSKITYSTAPDGDAGVRRPPDR